MFLKASSASSPNLPHIIPFSALQPWIIMQSALSALSLPASSWHLPPVLDVLIDEASDEHGYQRVIPGANEHEGQAEAHAQEGESPGK